jgi:Ca2+-binding RTX toxin-like protein
MSKKPIVLRIFPAYYDVGKTSWADFVVVHKSRFEIVLSDGVGATFEITGHDFRWKGGRLIDGVVTGSAVEDNEGEKVSRVTGFNYHVSDSTQSVMMIDLLNALDEASAHRPLEVIGSTVDDRLNFAGYGPAMTMLGNIGDDQLSGGAVDDLLVGGSGDDILIGALGNDVLKGGAGNDQLYGNWSSPDLPDEGADRLYGGTGNDILYGARGRDVMSGGTGIDYFIFLDASGRDTITDFDAEGGEAGQDFIFADFAEVLDIIKHGKDTIVDFGDGDKLVLLGIKPTDIDATDFTTVLPEM